MTITLVDIEFLVSSSGQQLLDRLAGEDLAESHTLSILTRLRRDNTAEQAGAALEIARLRNKAVEKFGENAAHMLFTREALEQASHPKVRHYRAKFVTEQQVIDVCCGIGADSLAMAQAGASVIGFDIDPVRVAIAQYNTTVLDFNARFEVADVNQGLPPADTIFFDPARRDEQGNRIYDVDRYQPPLSLVKTWTAPHIITKLSPGIDLSQLTGYDGILEFISVNGDLKEAVLWQGYGSSGLRSTLLIDDVVYHWQAAQQPALSRFSEPRAWLLEPDPALMRAGLIADAALQWNAYQLDETIAYLTADQCPESVWMRAWKIRDWMPFNLKRLRAYLRERDIGRVTVKKRGSAVTPEELIGKLKLKGKESCTLALTRLNGAPIVLICDDIMHTTIGSEFLKEEM